MYAILWMDASVHDREGECVVNAFGGDYSMSKLNVPKLQLLSAVSREIECMSLSTEWDGAEGWPLRQLLHSFRRDTCQLLLDAGSQSRAYPRNAAANSAKTEKAYTSKKSDRSIYTLAGDAQVS